MTTYRLNPPPFKYSAETFQLGQKRAGLPLKISYLPVAGNGRTLRKAAGSSSK